MPRRIKQKKPFLHSLADNFRTRLAGTDRKVRKKILTYGFATVGVLFLYSLMIGTYGIPRIVRLEMERRALSEANYQLRAEVVDAARIRRLLASDDSYIEYIARTRYRMIRPDETIYRYHGR